MIKTPFKDKHGIGICLADELRVQSIHNETVKIGVVVKRKALNDDSGFSILFSNGKYSSVSTYIDAIMRPNDEPHNWLEVIR